MADKSYDDLALEKEKMTALKLGRGIVARYEKEGRPSEAAEWTRILNSLGVGIDNFAD
jgi:hypothetical protein